jgi:hypothetical protein
MLICLGQCIHLLVLVTEVRFRFQVSKSLPFLTNASSVRGAAPFRNDTTVWEDRISHRGGAFWYLIVRQNITAWAAPI